MHTAQVPASGGANMNDFRLNAVESILDKQYRSYNWNNTKMLTLLTVDSLLATGIFIGFNPNYSLLFQVLLFLAFMSLVFSLVKCLHHSIPQVSSNTIGDYNLRTMVGISNIGIDEYHKNVCELDQDRLIELTCHQISGMARINMASHETIRQGVLATLVSVLIMTVAFAYHIFDTRYMGRSLDTTAAFEDLLER